MSFQSLAKVAVSLFAQLSERRLTIIFFFIFVFFPPIVDDQILINEITRVYFALKRKHFRVCYDTFKGEPQNRGWCIQDAVEF